MKSIMILGGSTTQIPFIKIAKDKGYVVVVTDLDKNAPAFQYADMCLNINALDKELVLQYAIKTNVKAILTKTEELLSTVAYINEKLDLRGIRSKAAKASINKLFLRQCMQKSNIYTPKSWKIKSFDEFEIVKNELVYPVVIKPNDGIGSRGVVKVCSEIEFKKNFNSSIQYSKSREIIIEKFVTGTDCTAEFITSNGRTYLVAVGEKIIKGHPHFVEVQHLFPANYNKKLLNEITQVCKETLKSAEVDNAVSFFDLKITDEGPVVIEMAARFAGDYICTDLIELSTGINMYELLIDILIGKEVVVNNRLNRFAAVQFVTEYNYSKVKENNYIILNDKNYVRHEYYNKEKTYKLRNSSDRLGYYIFDAENRNSLLSSLERISI